MITSVGEYWFLALGFPVIIFILVMFFARHLSKIAVLSDDETQLKKLKKESQFSYYFFAPIRFLLALSIIILPLYFSYLIFSAGETIESVRQDPQNNKLYVAKGFIFDPKANLGVYKLIPYLGMGDRLKQHLLPDASDGITLKNLTKSLQQTEVLEQSQRLILNTTNNPLYIEQHFYTDKDIKPMQRTQIMPHTLVAVPYGFFSPTRAGCDSKLPDRFTTDGVTSDADSFLLRVTEKPPEEC